ncbi:hypothetical protein O3P69_006910 [Scylla paramamosain]|uniref:Uncharacterized protein n=2 Tax=Scylla paramamosain TaxID=85552 RepID=A0AAW0U4P1_SCYPA
MATRRVTVAAVVALAVVAAAGMAMAMEEASPRQDEGNLTTIVEESLDELVDAIEEGLGLDDGDLSTLADSPTSSFGNVVYSTVGFVLGGLMLFVSIFDTTRKACYNVL